MWGLTGQAGMISDVFPLSLISLSMRCFVIKHTHKKQKLKKEIEYLDFHFKSKFT